MRRGSLAARLARWLPDEIVRELYEPSVADLERERIDGGLSGSRYTLRLLSLWRQCLALAFRDSASRRIPRRPADTPAARKEFTSMFARDLRHALRIFRWEPAFSGAAVIALMLGIGANVALFAVVEAVLLRPLPYPDSDRVIVLRHRDTRTGVGKQFLALGDVMDMRQRQGTLESLAPYSGFQSTLFDAPEPTPVSGPAFSPEMFDALRVRPAMGRVFNADDAKAKAQPVVMISHELWRTHLGSDPDILSRSIQLGAARRLVVGVLPEGFQFPPGQRTDAILPFPLPAAPPASRQAGWIFGLGRLKDGETVERARAEYSTLSRQMAEEYPDQNTGTTYEALTLRDTLVGDTKKPLLLLLVAAACVLLIACANVGNLLLARSLSRRQEFAMRLALGASRARLVSQVLTEGLVLAIAGGLVGTLAAWRLAPALAGMVPRSTPVPGLDAVQVNGWVLAFALLVSVGSALAFSAVAIVGLSRDGSGAARAARRVTMSSAARRAASSLVAVEVALAAVLLMGAGLTLRSFAKLMSVDPGFKTESVLTVQFSLPAGRYPDPLARRALFDRMFEAIERLPEVEAIGAAAVTPLTGNNWIVPFERPEHPTAPGQRPPEVGWQSASAGYFRALNIPLRAGRLFDERDVPKGAPVVIVSDALAQRYFAGEDPVGKRVALGPNQTAEIVGVVGSIRRASLADAPREDMYFPFEQGPPQGATLFVRTSGDPSAAWPALRSAIRDMERNAVLVETSTLDHVAEESAGINRLAMRLLGGFAVIALALAAVGIYGVMSYSVKRRTRELGTRVALGASRGQIVRLVMRHAVLVATVGLAAGLAAGLAGARALSGILFGVPTWDPVAIGAAAAALTLTAAVASYLPARRAARVDPVRTLAAD